MRMTMSREVDLGKEPVKHLLFILAVPAITSQVVNALYNMVDRMYIGHIDEVGAVALTGVGVCFPIIMIVSAFAYLVGMGGAPRASIFMGKRDNKTAEKILGNCFSALIIVAVILTAIVLIFRRPLLYLFGASDNTIVYAEKYITIYAMGTIFVQLTLGLNSFISAQGFSRVSMMTVIIGAAANIVLDPIFIFLLDMGVRGAAVATVVSQALSAVWAFKFLCGDKTTLRLKRENMKIEAHILSLRGAWDSSVYNDFHRKSAGTLLQFFSSQIRRRSGGGSHDYIVEHNAVCAASAAGVYTGRPADNKL